MMTPPPPAMAGMPPPPGPGPMPPSPGPTGPPPEAPAPSGAASEAGGTSSGGLFSWFGGSKVRVRVTCGGDWEWEGLERG